jgi:hypothetical protein
MARMEEPPTTDARKAASLRTETRAMASAALTPASLSSPRETARRAGRSAAAAPHFGSAPAAARRRYAGATSAIAAACFSEGGALR